MLIAESSCYGRRLQPGSDDPIIKMNGCPDCGGRGWFRTNPFAPYNADYRQCKTCEDAKVYFDAHGKLPDELTARRANHSGVALPEQPSKSGGGK